MSGEDAEAQRDEADVLLSIYADDGNFTRVNDAAFQYKIGEDGAPRSFLLQVSWPADYPSTSSAGVTLDLFYNKHLTAGVKEEIVRALAQESLDNVGMASTFALFEYAKEHAGRLTESQPETMAAATSDDVDQPDNEQPTADSASAGGKENAGRAANNMSKAAKRKMWDRVGAGGERQRGHDWVDVIRHLSQTGGQRVD